MSGVKRWVTVDAQGLALSWSDGFRGPEGSIAIRPGTEFDAFVGKEHRLRWAGGMWVLRDLIRLSVSTTIIDADGVDVAEVMVLGVPEGGYPVALEVNGQPEAMDEGEVLELGATTTAWSRWQVKLVDPRYYAEPPTREVVARPAQGGQP